MQNQFIQWSEAASNTSKAGQPPDGVLLVATNPHPFCGGCDADLRGSMCDDCWYFRLMYKKEINE